MKPSICSSLLAFVVLVSCTNSNDFLLNTAVPSNLEESLTIKRLEQLNDSIIQNNTPCIVSRSWENNLFITAADAYGAYKYGRRGAQIGSWTGTPHGTTVGAIIGGTFGAIKYSYRAYEKTKLEEDSKKANLKLYKITNAYCSLYRIDTSNFDYCLDFLKDKEFENAGEYHNRAISYLLDYNGYEISLLRDGNEIDTPAPDPIDPENYIELTPLERSIVENEDFSFVLDADETIFQISSADDFEFDNSTCGAVMQLYIDAIRLYNGYEAIRDVISLTNEYIDIVHNSSELTESEKENLYIAFSVGAYSYKYWSELFNKQ